MRAYEQHLQSEGKPQSHALAKGPSAPALLSSHMHARRGRLMVTLGSAELFAGFVSAEIDK